MTIYVDPAALTSRSKEVCAGLPRGVRVFGVRKRLYGGILWVQAPPTMELVIQSSSARV